MVARNQSAEDSSPLIQWLPRTAWINGNSADDQLPNYSQGSFMLTTTLNAKAQFSVRYFTLMLHLGLIQANYGPSSMALAYGESTLALSHIAVSTEMALRIYGAKRSNHVGSRRSPRNSVLTSFKPLLRDRTNVL